ncbi:hypothetical protein ACE7GA_02945 [Roseomonas sp. CCTCC AB2023176]|uniref:hypothetical protein n=1 Tax=Roseomonas sp. CCTCC AB2023176 TaxID=3342640 RepID=UPI0035DCE4B6
MIGLLLAAALFSLLAARIRVPCPALLALAGTAIALIPGVPAVTPGPALFVARVLLTRPATPPRATSGTTARAWRRTPSSPSG